MSKFGLRGVQRWGMQWGWLLGAIAALLSPLPALADDTEVLLLLTDVLSYPLDVRLLEPGVVPADRSIVTPETISQTGLTTPSLWWTAEQFGGTLLENWLAYPEAEGYFRRVDLVVNEIQWDSTNYLSRYSFVNHFGTSARSFGFNLRVFTPQQELVAAYICSPQPNSTQLRDCNIFLNPGGITGFRGFSTSPFAVPSTGDDKFPER